MHLKGVGGQVGFDGQVVTIDRKGALGRMSGGEAKVFHLGDLSGVQLKKATAMINGFIKFTPSDAGPAGAEPNELPRFATPDANSVMFTKKDQPAFEKLRLAVLEAIEARVESPQRSVPDQIEQLAALRDRDILSDEEFAKKKAELLRRM